MNPDTRTHVHKLIDHLPPGQLAAIETLLESMIDDEELTVEDRSALVVAELGFFKETRDELTIHRVADRREAYC